MNRTPGGVRISQSSGSGSTSHSNFTEVLGIASRKPDGKPSRWPLFGVVPVDRFFTGIWE